MEKECLNILVVDDEEAVRKALNRILRAENHTVFLAENGESALEVLNRLWILDKTVNLIVTDLYMPRMNGYELIRKLEQMQKRIPVLAITGYTNNQEFRFFESSGKYSILQKPFTMEEVLRKVAGLLDETNTVAVSTGTEIETMTEPALVAESV